MNRLTRRSKIILFSLFLFGLNVYICRELFTAGYLRNLDSNEGAFVSFSRFYRDNWHNFRFFPWFNAGMPIENAYQPLLPVIAALTDAATAWDLVRAFHFVLAMAYCLGAVTLFWFVFDWSESFVLGGVTSLAYSLLSPAQLLIPILRLRSEGHWGPLRLFNLVHYAEDPHNVALTLLPLALLFLRRSMLRPHWRNVAPSIVFCAAVVLCNAFGAVDLLLAGVCIGLALRRGWTVLLGIGFASYCWISPWLPPSLIRLLSHDQWSERGAFNAGALSYAAAALLLLLLAGAWLFTRRMVLAIERFAALFALLAITIPVAYFSLHVTLVPQASRYQLELETGACIVIGCIFARIASRSRRTGRVLLAIVVLLVGVQQARTYRRFARKLIEPVDIAQTIEYKTVSWLGRNLPAGDRAMVSGDTEFLYNIYSSNPQMSGGHQPTAPNQIQKVAVYAIYVGSDGGPTDAEGSILWLKAYGNQAVTVPGEKSREFYHPIVHPHKFDGILPVLWHEEDDTIFAVPQRSRSLAHVIPKQALVPRTPIHGLDIDPLRPYVAALDDSGLPLAEFKWTDISHAAIRAQVHRGQVLSVQINYDPGWQASIGGQRIPVHSDALGLMVLEPGCEGTCEIDLWFGASAEAWICRILSALVTLAPIGYVLKARYFRSNS